jgi:Protein of unknown function (DUF559)/Transcriptional regulator, AbiEi antitoxin
VVSSIDDACGRQSCAASVAALAARQHGVVSLAQLEALGLGARGAQHRASRGHLHRIHRGVYAVGHPLLTADGVRMAAVLACGPGAVCSHRSAAAAWGLRPTSRTRVEVTTTRRGRTSRPGIELRHVAHLSGDDVARLRSIPVTSVARTLVDLAAVLPSDALERAVHQADVLRLLDVRAVLRVAQGRPGADAVRAVLADPSAGDTRSALEERFLALCRRAGVPLPRLNAHVALADRLVEVDALWPSERLVVELDGAAVHQTARAFHQDRRRDAALTARGYAVVRLTWPRVVRERETVVEELRRLLTLRAA